MSIRQRRRNRQTNRYEEVNEDRESIINRFKLSPPHYQGVFILTIVFVVTYYMFIFDQNRGKWNIDWWNHEMTVEEKQEEQRRHLKGREPEVIGNLTANTPYILHEFCDSFNECFNVDQRFYIRDKKMIGSRSISMKKRPALVLTISHLIVPNIITPYYLKPENWRINHRHLVSTYNTLQAAAGFMMEALSFDDPHRLQRVLQIGMGGGVTTNFLSLIPINLSIDVVELEQSVYQVAKDYFEFTNSPKVNVFIEDGVDFLKRVISQGVTYDSLLLDACTNDVESDVLCPAPVFMESKVIEMLSKAIGETGVLSVNIFAPRQQVNTQEDVLELYRKFFGNCFTLQFQYQQRMLFCTNRPNYNYLMNYPRFKYFLQEFDFRMKTKLGTMVALGS